LNAGRAPQLKAGVGWLRDGYKEMWKCLNCAEEVEDHFEVCWNCEANRNGILPVRTSFPQDSREKEEKDFLNEKFRSKSCLRCDVVLTYAGRKDFHEGVKLGALGDLAELFIGQTKLEMYVCPGCLRVEFFMSDSNF
jgi:hypothetical protein